MTLSISFLYIYIIKLYAWKLYHSPLTMDMSSVTAFAHSALPL